MKIILKSLLILSLLLSWNILNGIHPESKILIPSLESHQSIAQEIHCMKALLIHEASNQGSSGMLAVAQVAINRKEHQDYPENICAVVKQHRQFSDILRTFRKLEQQQSHRKPLNALEARVATLVSTIAYKAILEPSYAFQKHSKVHSKVLWYHTINAKPVWRKKLKKFKVIKDHVFYESKD